LHNPGSDKLLNFTDLNHEVRVTTDFMADEGPWQPVSVCSPLIRAGVRLYAAQHAIPKIAAAAEQLATAAQASVKETVDLTRKDPEWFMEADETEEALAQETDWISDELPLMLLGQIPVYLFSVLETALSGCLAIAAAAQGLSKPRATRGPKLESYVKALGDACGVVVEWDAGTWRELRTWRRRRNSTVHGLDFSLDAASRRDAFVLQDFWEAGEIPSATQVQQLLRLVSTAIEAIDQAMYSAGIRSGYEVQTRFRE